MGDILEILLWVFVGATVLWTIAMVLLYVALGAVLGDVVAIAATGIEKEQGHG